MVALQCGSGSGDTIKRTTKKRGPIKVTAGFCVNPGFLRLPRSSVYMSRRKKSAKSSECLVLDWLRWSEKNRRIGTVASQEKNRSAAQSKQQIQGRRTANEVRQSSRERRSNRRHRPVERRLSAFWTPQRIIQHGVDSIMRVAYNYSRKLGSNTLSQVFRLRAWLAH